MLERFTAGIQDALRANFIGADLVGSLATGDFDLDSDIDFLVITNKEPTAAEVLLLEALNREIHSLGSYPAEHLEGSYLGKDMLAREDMCSPCNRSELQCRVKRPICGKRNMRSMSKRVAWLCLALTLWSLVAFATHNHSGLADSATCTVCVAAHSASPVTTSRLPKAVFVPVRVVLVSEPVSAKQRLISFALAVRPPPEV